MKSKHFLAAFLVLLLAGAVYLAYGSGGLLQGRFQFKQVFHQRNPFQSTVKLDPSHLTPEIDISVANSTPPSRYVLPGTTHMVTYKISTLGQDFSITEFGLENNSPENNVALETVYLYDSNGNQLGSGMLDANDTNPAFGLISLNSPLPISATPTFVEVWVKLSPGISPIAQTNLSGLDPLLSLRRIHGESASEEPFQYQISPSLAGNPVLITNSYPEFLPISLPPPNHLLIPSSNRVIGRFRITAPFNLLHFDEDKLILKKLDLEIATTGSIDVSNVRLRPSGDKKSAHEINSELLATSPNSSTYRFDLESNPNILELFSIPEKKFEEFEIVAALDFPDSFGGQTLQIKMNGGQPFETMSLGGNASAPGDLEWTDGTGTFYALNEELILFPQMTTPFSSNDN